MSKLRTYLDAGRWSCREALAVQFSQDTMTDGNPALSFRLFMHALLAYGLERFDGVAPEFAISKVVTVYMLPFIRDFQPTAGPHPLNEMTGELWYPLNSSGCIDETISIEACASKALVRTGEFGPMNRKYLRPRHEWGWLYNVL